MLKSVVYTSDNDNLYLYNIRENYSLLIHPDLGKIYQGSSDEVSPYYHNKYEYLRRMGVFSSLEFTNFDTILDKSVVDNNIQNIRQIVFETTDYCNLNCSYCSLGNMYNFSKDNPKNIKEEYAINFLDFILKIKPKGSKLMIGFFGGEPLVNVKFVKRIVERVKKINIDKEIDVSYNMTTNGTLLGKNLDFLLDNKFSLLISLDGDEFGNYYRKYKNGEMAFSDVINNIDTIYKKNPDYFIDHVNFNSVLNDKNTVRSIYEFIYNRYHKIPIIAQINTGNLNSLKLNLFKKMFRNKRESEKSFVDSKCELSYLFHQELGSYRDLSVFLHYNSINYYILDLLQLIYEDISLYPTGTCFPFQRKMFLNTNSDLLPCEKVCYQHVLGHVDDNVTIDIDEIIQRYNGFYKYFKEICQYCYSQKSCSICLLSLENLDKIGTTEFSCPGFMGGTEFGSKLSAVFSFLESHPRDFFKAMDKVMI